MNKPKCLYSLDELKGQSLIILLGCSLLFSILVISGTHRTATAQDGVSLYQLHRDGKIWRYTGQPCSGASCPGWQMLDNNPRTVAIAAGGPEIIIDVLP